MFAVLLATNGESLAVEDEDAVGRMRIHKDGTREIAVQGTHDRCVLTHVLCVPYATVSASVQHVTTVKRRCRFPSSRLDSERVFACIAFPPTTTEPDGLS